MSEALGENRKTQRELHQCGFCIQCILDLIRWQFSFLAIGICNHARICVCVCVCAIDFPYPIPEFMASLN